MPCHACCSRVQVAVGLCLTSTRMSRAACADACVVRFLQVIRKTPDEIQPDVSPQHEYQLLAVATDLGETALDFAHCQTAAGYPVCDPRCSQVVV
jgi:hypothetical protein